MCFKNVAILMRSNKNARTAARLVSLSQASPAWLLHILQKRLRLELLMEKKHQVGLAGIESKRTVCVELIIRGVCQGTARAYRTTVTLASRSQQEGNES